MFFCYLKGQTIWLLTKMTNVTLRDNPAIFALTHNNRQLKHKPRCIHYIPMKRKTVLVRWYVSIKGSDSTWNDRNCGTFSKFPRKIGTSQLWASSRWLALFSSFALTSVKAGGQSLRVLLLDLLLSSSAEELEGQTRVRQRKTNRKHNYVVDFYLYV